MTLAHIHHAGEAASALPAWGYLIGAVPVVITFILLTKRHIWSPTHNNGVSLPPGPPAKWFWQNPMPDEDIAHALSRLVEQYGPLVSLRSGGHVTIIIGSVEAANDLMEKEGGALSGRPRMIAAGELLEGQLNIIYESAGDRFRRLRRVVHTHLQPKAAETYEEIQVEAAQEAILNILNDPKQHMQHAHRYATTVSLRVTYGKSAPTSSDDPEMVRLEQVTKNFQRVSRPGTYLVDLLPWLKYLPGYGRELRNCHQYAFALYQDQLNRVKDEMRKNVAGPSFGKTLLENSSDQRLSDDEMIYLAGTLYVAGSDTTACGITVMIMAAACHPEAQARVHEELDEVVGMGRVPTFGDKDMLPQLQAFMLEALRWRPLTPLGFAHLAMRDIIWKGQCIPAGTPVLGCHWAISRDPVAFPDPEAFDPGRWLTEDGCIRTDMQSYTYGFGRRVCPGQHVANRSLYINIALLLWSFRILQRPEAPIIHDASGFQNPIVFHPKPFQVEFVPRVEEQKLRQLMV